jgi:probable phosphoglycerate mutase
MLFYCIRHGESTYNASGRIQGQSDVPLSELGRRQSEAVAAALGPLPIEALYSSPLRRAMETAQPVAEALGLPIQTDPRLMEIHAGVFEDQLRNELDRLFPEALARWRSGDPDFAIPGGESRRKLMERGREAFEAILQAGRRQVAVVSHGGLIAAAIKSLLEIPAGRHPFNFYNGSISQLAVDGAKVKLLTLNQTDHLRDLATAAIGDL